MTPASRKAVEISITVHCDLTDGSGGERWDILAVTDDSTGEELGDIGIYTFDAYSDFPGKIGDAVRDIYFHGMLIDADILYSLEISIRSGGSEIGTSTRLYRGNHPCARDDAQACLTDLGIQ
jgi:hypothetical protein